MSGNVVIIIDLKGEEEEKSQLNALINGKYILSCLPIRDLVCHLIVNNKVLPM